MAQKSFFIRRMEEREVALAVDWAADEGWNPGLNDAQCFHSADQGGFFIALEAGVPFGSVSAVRYGSEYGFIGFYIVRPEFRGRGYGMKLWQSALQHLSGRVIGLDGVLAQQENYQKSGFQLAYRNIRYQMDAFEALADCDKACPVGVSIVPLSERFEKAKLEDYDRSIFLADRACFLAKWLEQADAKTLIALNGEAVVGYGVVRRCRSGWKIGPLFADDAVIAERLLHGLACAVKWDVVFLDVPEVNVAAVALAEKYKMSKVFETARMYKGKAPLTPLEKVFGVTSFELG